MNRLGAKFFAAAGSIALILAAVYQLRATQAAAMGLVAGAALIAVAELLVAARSEVTASALDAAGIAILYAALYSMRHNAPLAAVFIGMLAVSVVAVFLARRRDSLFVAVLGIGGGFVNAWLLSTTADYPLPVFAYLLALNVAVAWLVIEKRWWLLLALTIVFTAIYEFAWVLQALDVRLLPVAAAIFLVCAAVGTIPLWHRDAAECPDFYRWLAIAAAHLPLLFAIYVAGQVNYAPQYWLLFGYLLLVDAGLVAISWRLTVGGWQKSGAGVSAYGQRPTANRQLFWSGGIATLLVIIIWFRVSFTDAAWPWLLIFAGLFIALYLIRVTPFAGLMFAFFVGLCVHAPAHAAVTVAAMFFATAVVLVVAMKRGEWLAPALAIALSSVALMTLHGALMITIVLHAILFAQILILASRSGHHVLAILAIPFFVAMIITAYAPPTPALWIAALPYALFAAYPLVLGARARSSLAPYVAAALATLVVFIAGWPSYAGWVALAATLLMALLLWRAISLEPREPRLTLLLALALGFSDVAVLLLLSKAWAAVYFAAAVAFCVWLFTRMRHPVLVLWATGLAAVVFLWLAFDADLFALWYVYLACGGMMFAAAYLIRRELPLLQRVFSVACLFELWFMINLLIANYFHSANGAVVFDFAAAQPLENAVYTIGWAVIATALLILGYLIRWPAARGAAIALLIASVLKAFLSDLPLLHAPYLTAALAGLGLSVAVVAIVLQRQWVGKSLGLDLPYH